MFCRDVNRLLTMASQSSDGVAWCQAPLSGPWLGGSYICMYMNAVDTRRRRPDARSGNKRQKSNSPWTDSAWQHLHGTQAGRSPSWGWEVEVQDRPRATRDLREPRSLSFFSPSSCLVLAVCVVYSRRRGSSSAARRETASRHTSSGSSRKRSSSSGGSGGGRASS